jgi:hypothetical protein
MIQDRGSISGERQLTSMYFADKRVPELPQLDAFPFKKASAWHTFQKLDGFEMTSHAGRQRRTVLLPVQDAKLRFERARTIADDADGRPILFACTHAREAHYLSDGQDPRDRRYLSGVRNYQPSIGICPICRCNLLLLINN